MHRIQNGVFERTKHMYAARGFYYSCLSTTGKILYDRILDHAVSLQERVSLRGVPEIRIIPRKEFEKNALDALQAVLLDNPCLFFLDRHFTLMLSPVYGIELQFTYKKEKLRYYVTVCDNALDAILRDIRTNCTDPSDQGRLLYTHNYLMEKVSYETGKEYSYTILSILTLKKGCCQSYSGLFKILMNALGIPCIIVTGTSLCDGTRHAWNMVKVSGRFSHVDVTNGKTLRGILFCAEDDVMNRYCRKSDFPYPECVR